MARNSFENARDAEIYALPFSRDDLLNIRRQLAKAANQRMVRLENTTSKVTGEAYTFGAYDVAQKYLEEQGRESKKQGIGLRFSERKDQEDMTDFKLKQEISELQNFLKSKSSSIKGMHEIEEKRQRSFQEGYGPVNKKGEKTKKLSKPLASTKDFYDFLNSKSYELLAESWNSNDIIDVFDRAYKKGLTAKEIWDEFEDFVNRNDQESKRTRKRLVRKLTYKANKKRKKR